MELVIALIEGRAPAERQVLLDAQLVVRAWCGAPEALRTPELDAEAVAPAAVGSTPSRPVAAGADPLGTMRP